MQPIRTSTIGCFPIFFPTHSYKSNRHRVVCLQDITGDNFTRVFCGFFFCPWHQISRHQPAVSVFVLLTIGCHKLLGFLTFTAFLVLISLLSGMRNSGYCNKPPPELSGLTQPAISSWHHSPRWAHRRALHGAVTQDPGSFYLRLQYLLGPQRPSLTPLHFGT